MGGIAVIGDVFILPVSGRTVRLPLTRTSHLPPPCTRDIQAFPVYLYKHQCYGYKHTFHTLMCIHTLYTYELTYEASK